MIQFEQSPNVSNFQHCKVSFPSGVARLPGLVKFGKFQSFFYINFLQTLQAKQKNLKRSVKAMDLSSDKFDLCNQTLTDLWNICPDNLAACQDSNRKFTPEVSVH